ncbi:MAG: carboxypeptidase regulatory-like domain-containing protein [Planctomycetes bacterium]|nr:carboxypeptidase regulatory-like domain-containing protein [Planctomycetota bacterium]
MGMHPLSPLALTLLVGPVAAQSPAPTRVAHPGRVLDAAGAPVAGAEVVFANRDPGDGLLAADVVRVATGPDGRFRAELLPTRPYVVWAVAEVDGEVRVTPLARRGSPATELRIDELATVAVRSGRLDGAAAWTDLGGLGVQFVVAGRFALAEPVSVAADGSFALPILPPTKIAVLVFAGDRLVHSADVTLESEPVVELPPPSRIRAKVVDVSAAARLPVAGARLFRTVGAFGVQLGPLPPRQFVHRFPIGESDAQGEAELLFAHAGEPLVGKGYPVLAFAAVKPGYSDALSGVVEQPFANDRMLGAEPGADLLVFRTTPLAKDEQPTRIVGAGRPRRVVVDGAHSAPTGDHMYYQVRDRIGLELLPDGAVPPYAAPPGFRVEALRVPGVLPELAADDPFRRVSVPRTLLLPCDAALGGTRVALDAVVPVRLLLVDTDGGPAADADVLCVPQSGDGFLPIEGAEVAAADLGGRVVLPATVGDWLVVAFVRDQFVAQKIEVRGDLPVQTLRLEPLAHCRLRFVDGAGQPLAGVRLRAGGSAWGSSNEPTEQFLLLLANSIAAWHLSQAVSDADGRVDVPFLAVADFEAKFVGRHRGRQSEKQQLRDYDEPVDVVIE